MELPIFVLQPLFSSLETGKVGVALVLSGGLEPSTHGLENHRSGPTEL